MSCKHLKFVERMNECVRERGSEWAYQRFFLLWKRTLFKVIFSLAHLNTACKWIFAFHDSLSRVFLFIYSFNCFRFRFFDYYPLKLYLSLVSKCASNWNTTPKFLVNFRIIWTHGSYSFHFVMNFAVACCFAIWITESIENHCFYYRCIQL